jgi:hypothetical protein
VSAYTLTRGGGVVVKRVIAALVAAAALVGTNGAAQAVPLHEHLLTNAKTGNSTRIGGGFCAHPDLFAHGMPLHAVFEHFHYTVHSGAAGAATLGGNADVAFTNPNNPVAITLVACPTP